MSEDWEELTDGKSIVKWLRKQARLTQAELGKRCNMSDTYFSNIERGGSRISLDVFLDVLKATGFEMQIVPAEDSLEEDTQDETDRTSEDD